MKSITFLFSTIICLLGTSFLATAQADFETIFKAEDGDFLSEIMYAEAGIVPNDINKITTATIHSNVDIISDMYKAFETGDIDGVFASMHDKIEWNEAENFLYAEGNPYIGAEAIMNGVFARIGADWEYFKTVNLLFHDMSNDQVLVTGRYQGKLKSNGQTVDAQFAHHYYLNAGKVTSFQQYTDTMQFAKAVIK